MAVDVNMLENLIIDILKKNFTSKPVDEKTVMKKVLKTTDGVGEASSANVFRALVAWNFSNWGQPAPKWPEGWLDLTVLDLATKIA